MKEYRKRDVIEIEKTSQCSHEKYRARKRPFASSELYNEKVSSDVSGQANMCFENQHEQANCLKVMNFTEL